MNWCRFGRRNSKWVVESLSERRELVGGSKRPCGELSGFLGLGQPSCGTCCLDPGRQDLGCSPLTLICAELVGEGKLSFLIGNNLDISFSDQS